MLFISWCHRRLVANTSGNFTCRLVRVCDKFLININTQTRVCVCVCVCVCARVRVCVCVCVRLCARVLWQPQHDDGALPEDGERGLAPGGGQRCGHLHRRGAGGQ